jgi:hypothetical protein
VLGHAFVRLKRGEHRFTVGRQDSKLPYVNRQDSRMVPNTFAGAVLGRGTRKTRFAWVAGWIAEMKKRNSNLR